jgi:hypothetical protein
LGAVLVARALAALAVLVVPAPGWTDDAMEDGSARCALACALWELLCAVDAADEALPVPSLLLQAPATGWRMGSSSS